MYNSRPGVKAELGGRPQPATPAARPAPAIPTHPQNLQAPRANGTGNYGPFPQAVPPPANPNPPQTAVYANNPVSQQRAVAPPLPPRPDLTPPQRPAAPRAVYANNPVQTPTILPPAQRPTAPQPPQYANASRAIYANNPVQNDATIPAPAQQRPAVPSRPQFSGVGNSQVDGLPLSFPKAKPYMAKIPDKAQIEKFLAEARSQGGNPAPHLAQNAAPGVRPNAPSLPQPPPNVQRSAPGKGENPYGKLSAAIMNNGARQTENPYGKMTDVKNATPAKAESPYGRMTDIAAKNGMPVSPNPPGKYSAVNQTGSKALDHRK